MLCADFGRVMGTLCAGLGSSGIMPAISVISVLAPDTSGPQT